MNRANTYQPYPTQQEEHTGHLTDLYKKTKQKPTKTNINYYTFINII